MLQIALCDDEPEELSRIETLLCEYANSCPEQGISHRCFLSMESLLMELEVRAGFDLLLPDVCLPQKNGSEHSIRMTATELIQSLSQYPDFVRCGTPYIVNLAHVSDLSHGQLRLDTGKVLWNPRGAYAELKERYFHFYCSEGEQT